MLRTLFHSTAHMLASAILSVPLEMRDFKRITGFINTDKAGTVVFKQGNSPGALYQTDTSPIVANVPLGFAYTVSAPYGSITITNTAVTDQTTTDIGVHGSQD